LPELAWLLNNKIAYAVVSDLDCLDQRTYILVTAESAPAAWQTTLWFVDIVSINTFLKFFKLATIMLDKENINE
jgi:hypothetical protein